jgi:hypothetical protein
MAQKTLFYQDDVLINSKRYSALSMHLEYAPKSNVATPGFKNETMLSLCLLIVNNGTGPTPTLRLSQWRTEFYVCCCQLRPNN